jgi:hypothetical protein
MSGPSLCLLVIIVPSLIAHTGVSALSPRQDVPAVNAALSTSTSSFNWWPYPAGGLSTSSPGPTPMSMISASILNSSAKSTIPLSSASQTTSSSHSSPVSPTRATVSTSLPATSPPSKPQPLLKPGQIPINPLWLVPLCLISGAVIGCAVGWLAWRRCGEKRDRMGVGPPSGRYAWTHNAEMELEYDDDDGKDEEHGYSHDYAPLGKQPAYHVERNLRMPRSPLPSTSSHGDEGDEQLGFAEAEGHMEKEKTTVYDGEGRHTWSAGATQKRGGAVGRSLSFLARRKTMKEGRVELWVRRIMGEEEGHMSPRPVRQQEASSVSMCCEKTAPQPGTPDLALSTLCRISSSTWHSPDFDEDHVITFNGKSLEPHPSTSHHMNSTVVPQPVATRSGLRGNPPHTEQCLRDVSLRDPGSGSIPPSVITRTRSASRNAFPLRTTTSKYPQRSTSPTPLSTSRNTALTSPNRSPTQSTTSRDLCSTLTGATPPSRLARPVSSTTRPARDSGTPPRNCPLPSGDRHTTSHQRLASELPAGPSYLVSSHLQSDLCFDEALLPLTAPSRASTTASMAGTKLAISSHAHRYSAKRVSDSGSTPLNARAHPPPPPHTPSPVPAPRPFSPKERYLARQNANTRVGMILSQSYNSHSFDERPVSPNMFGAVINEEIDSEHLEDTSHVYRAEGGDGIEQRLDTPGT